LDKMRMDVASYNEKAAQARSIVLKSQGIISFTELKLPQVEEALSQHQKQCATDQAALVAQIGVVAADLNVTAGILEIIGDCGAAAQAALVQCRHCAKTGKGYVMIQNDVFQPLINKLKSAAAKSYLQTHLNQLYAETTEDQEPEELSQEAVRHMTALMTGRSASQLRGSSDVDQDPSDPELLASLGNETNVTGLNISEVPEDVAPAECLPTNKCTLGKGSCTKIRDRFLYIQSGIQDMYSKLKSELEQLIAMCNEVRIQKENQIADLNDQKRDAQTDLASATKDQVSSESSSNTIAAQHVALKAEYIKTMKECCDEQNDLKSEMCALEKIRGELYKMKGEKIFITDCEVSDFKSGECSASCGGGVLEKTRSILVHPINGMACPPLTLKESCNTQPCPIDCVVGEWEGWSGCSAECGGGVRERMRPVLTPMENEGKPCDDTEETEGCNAQSCNADCVLADWTDWGACTQACQGGTSRRERAVDTPAAGTGSCPLPSSKERLEFRDCNTQACTGYVQGFLTCKSKIDLVVLLDGSGSLGVRGFDAAKTYVKNLVSHLDPAQVQVAVQIFSGPSNWAAYQRCTGVSPDAPDMIKDCMIEWVNHFSNDTKKIVAAVDALKFPASTTLTSVALAEAASELVNGREDANSIVVVVTDGQPLSHERTKTAAERLMAKARVVWVPVGSAAPLEMIEELASLPKKENVVKIPSLGYLAWRKYVNDLIVQTCPEI